MGKGKMPKPNGGAGSGSAKKPAPANSGGSSSLASAETLRLVWMGSAVAIAVAIAVAFTLRTLAAAPPTASTMPSSSNAAAEMAREPPRPPARCIDGWAECPRVPGADWVALEELEAAVKMAEFDAASIEACLGPTPLLSPEPVQGMHLLCVLPPPRWRRENEDEVRGGEEAGVAAMLAVFPMMERRERPSRVVLLPQLSKADDIITVLRYKLRFPSRGPKYQRPALFTEDGVRLVKAEAALGRGNRALHRLLCLEGGQWLWPPVEKGHVHIIHNLTAPGVDTRVVTVSLKPLVVEVENFLSAEESKYIIERASPHMEKSGVALKDADIGKAAKEFRTSSQYFLPTTRDPMLEKIDRRVQYLTRIPISHAEYIQVLRYNHMEHYSAHHDFFDPAAYASSPDMLASVEHGARNRLATVFFYLNNMTNDPDVTKGGGQTNFPRAATSEFPQGGPQPYDYFDCSKGLSVYPQEGKVIIFYSMLPNGQMDDFSLHGGCDVFDPSATKWSANFWLWNKPYQFNDVARKTSTAMLQQQYL